MEVRFRIENAPDVEAAIDPASLRLVPADLGRLHGGQRPAPAKRDVHAAAGHLPPLSRVRIPLRLRPVLLPLSPAARTVNFLSSFAKILQAIMSRATLFI